MRNLEQSTENLNNWASKRAFKLRSKTESRISAQTSLLRSQRMVIILQHINILIIHVNVMFFILIILAQFCYSCSKYFCCGLFKLQPVLLNFLGGGKSFFLRGRVYFENRYRFFTIIIGDLSGWNHTG